MNIYIVNYEWNEIRIYLRMDNIFSINVLDFYDI